MEQRAGYGLEDLDLPPHLHRILHTCNTHAVAVQGNVACEPPLARGAHYSGDIVCARTTSDEGPLRRATSDQGPLHMYIYMYIYTYSVYIYTHINIFQYIGIYI